MHSFVTAIVLAGMVVVAGSQATPAGTPPASPQVPAVTGKVYDLDYIQNLNWCQVLIRDGFVGFVRDVRLQQAMETAMQLDIPVTAYHEDGQPRRVYRMVVDRKPPADPLPEGLHYVTKLEMDEQDGKCKATFVGSDKKEVTGFTRDARMESLLVTAFREGWRVGYLALDDKTKEITRGKLNIEDQRGK